MTCFCNLVELSAWAPAYNQVRLSDLVNADIYFHEAFTPVWDQMPSGVAGRLIEEMKRR